MDAFDTMSLDTNSFDTISADRAYARKGTYRMVKPIYGVFFILVALSGLVFQSCKAEGDFIEIKEEIHMLEPGDNYSKIVDCSNPNDLSIDVAWSHKNDDDAVDKYELWVNSTLVEEFEPTQSSFQYKIALTCKNDCSPNTWLVRARNNYQYSNSEDAGNIFLINNASLKPLTPASTDLICMGQPFTFTWQDGCFEKYTIVVADDPAATHVVKEFTSTEASFETQFDVSGVFYWYVYGTHDKVDYKDKISIGTFEIKYLEDAFRESPDVIEKVFKDQENSVAIFFKKGMGSLVKNLTLNGDPFELDGDAAIFTTPNLLAGEFVWSYQMGDGFCEVSFTHVTKVLETCPALNPNVTWSSIPIVVTDDPTKSASSIEPGWSYDPINKSMIYIFANSTYLIDLKDLSDVPTTVTITDLTPTVGTIDNNYTYVQQADNSMVYDFNYKTRRMITFSPFLEGSIPNVRGTDETYTLYLDDFTIGWTDLETTGKSPSSRSDHATVIIPYESPYFPNYMFLFGGHDTARSMKCVGDFFLLNLNATPAEWMELDVSGTAPSPRAAVRLEYVEVLSSIFMYGGRYTDNIVEALNTGEFTIYNDLWSFSLVTQEWTKEKFSGTGPAKAHEYGMCRVDPCRILVGGGVKGNDTDGTYDCMDTFYYLNFTTNQWEPGPNNPIKGPKEIWGGAMTYDRDRKVLFLTTHDGYSTDVLWVAQGF